LTAFGACIAEEGRLKDSLLGLEHNLIRRHPDPDRADVRGELDPRSTGVRGEGSLERFDRLSAELRKLRY
jgi:hypothetical protein